MRPRRSASIARKSTTRSVVKTVQPRRLNPRIFRVLERSVLKISPKTRRSDSISAESNVVPAFGDRLLDWSLVNSASTIMEDWHGPHQYECRVFNCPEGPGTKPEDAQRYAATAEYRP